MFKGRVSVFYISQQVSYKPTMLPRLYSLIINTALLVPISQGSKEMIYRYGILLSSNGLCIYFKKHHFYKVDGFWGLLVYFSVTSSATNTLILLQLLLTPIT